jgi:hypothetical protein
MNENSDELVRDRGLFEPSSAEPQRAFTPVGGLVRSTAGASPSNANFSINFFVVGKFFLTETFAEHD